MHAPAGNRPNQGGDLIGSASGATTGFIDSGCAASFGVAPPNLLDGVVHHTRAEADPDPKHFDGKTTEQRPLVAAQRRPIIPERGGLRQNASTFVTKEGTELHW